MQNCLDSVLQWAKVWQLTLFVGKCKILVLLNVKCSNVYNLDGTPLPNVNPIADLGVVMDNQLTFKLHINGIVVCAKQRALLTPKEASRKENENKVWRNLYPEFGGKTMTPKFSIGDNVRITKKKKTFYKGYTQRWTEDVFTIFKIQLTIPVTCKITDYNGEKIPGSFYEQELQKSKQDIFRIEKLIKEQGNKSYVKWLGYHELFKSWVDNKDINKL